MAVDLGFAGIIEKFEEHWGKRATRWLLMLIGVAVAAACIGAIWTWLISPVLVFLQSPLWERTLASLFLAIIGIGAGISVGLSLTTALARWRRTRQLKGYVAEARKMMAEAQTQTDEMIRKTKETLSLSEAQLDKIADSSTQSRELMEMALINARSAVEMNESLTAEERANWLAQLDQIKANLDATPSAKEEYATGFLPEKPM